MLELCLKERPELSRGTFGLLSLLYLFESEESGGAGDPVLESRACGEERAAGADLGVLGSWGKKLRPQETSGWTKSLGAEGEGDGALASTFRTMGSQIFHKCLPHSRCRLSRLPSCREGGLLPASACPLVENCGVTGAWVSPCPSSKWE